jgi:hypothetical protein
MFCFKIPSEKIFQFILAWTAFVQPHLSECRANERHIMTNTNATDQQLELGFNGLPPRASAGREGRIARANWWFARMRAIVEQAMDWSVPAEPRPEQIWMPGARREVKV